MTVHASPQSLAGTGFNIESVQTGMNPTGAYGTGTVSRLMITSQGHALSGAGVKALLAAFNTYISGLSASQAGTLIAALGDNLIAVGTRQAALACFTSDIIGGAGLLSSITTVLTTSGNASKQ